MAIAIAVFLVITMLVARNWPSSPIKLSNYSPLDIDKRIPFPEAGQGSTIFSLTALFGPYLAMFLLLGFPSIIGLSVGSIVGLQKLKTYMTRNRADSFENLIKGS